MPKTVDEGFRTFLRRLTPTDTQSAAAKSHRASIEAVLKEKFGITRFFRSGSFGNGTSVRGFSDVDYFAVVPTDKLKQNSDSTLRAVRDTLDARFPNTGVAVTTPAVLVPFGTDASESTEVVPADFVKAGPDGHSIYEIADGSGGWMKASPDAHNAYVASVDKKLGGKVKPLIRFVKAWKYYRKAPILSFYLELRVAKYASAEQDIAYSVDFARNLSKLFSDDLAAIRDPMGVSGNISPCSSEIRKSDSLSKLETALGRARKAIAAAKEGKNEDAYYWWNLVFDGNFPAYG